VDEYRKTVLEVESVGNLGLTGLRKLFGGKPQETLAYGRVLNDARHDRGFTAAGFSGEHDNCVLRQRARQRRLFDRAW